MSSAIIVVTVLLGSSLAVAFILQPSNEEHAESAHAPVSSPNRCQGESWQSIRKGLLEALGLQTEPRLPAGGLDRVRDQWQRTLGTISHGVQYNASPARSDSTASHEAGNSTSLKCCTVTSEISMKDLGWDTWVIQPLSLILVQCAHCSCAENTVQCPPTHAAAQDASSPDRLPCCQPTAYEMVPILYMDQFGHIVISSMQLPRGCGCDPGGVQPQSTE